MIAHDGGSGAGESGHGRCLRAVLPDAWPAFGIDGFADALPARSRGADGGIARRGRRDRVRRGRRDRVRRGRLGAGRGGPPGAGGGPAGGGRGDGARTPGPASTTSSPAGRPPGDGGARPWTDCPGCGSVSGAAPGGTASASASRGRPRQLSSRRRTSSSSHFLVSRGWV
ncbi:hypothetical protein ACFY8B_02755 [Streptomyces sp. NPDC012751]|uniref:phosphotransferase-like protein n=1 Tax=Streptomyces sp. NPDC012751 TaxID=3364846 RepID=UPI0036A433E6